MSIHLRIVNHVRAVGAAAVLLRASASMILFLASVQHGHAAGEYKLDAGDILEVSVFRRTELNRRMTVDADGNVLVPLIGEVKAAGLSLGALRTKVKELLATSDSVRGADVTLEVAEYRPFYIYGSVTKAGSYPYRPGISVRHAMALAGGLGQIGQSTAVTPVEAAELRGRYETLRGELAVQQIRVAGLKAETEGKSDIDLKAVATGSLARPEVKELASLEVEHLRARHADRQKEQQYLTTAVTLADSHVAALERGQKGDEEATRQQVQEVDRIVELSRKGLASSARVTDEQRAAVLLKSRELDTVGRLALARQAREDLQWRLEKVDNRHTRIPPELQAAMNTLEDTRAKLSQVGEQLVLSGLVGSQLDGSARNRGPAITIFRKNAAGEEIAIEASESTPIEPSDVVEIRIRFDSDRAPSVN